MSAYLTFRRMLVAFSGQVMHNSITDWNLVVAYHCSCFIRCSELRLPTVVQSSSSTVRLASPGSWWSEALACGTCMTWCRS
jgi:hypothetical protein